MEKFELESGQEQFAAYPKEIVKTLDDSERHYILIIQDRRVVGYFVLYENNGPLEIGSHKKAGFADTGMRRSGKQGKQFIYQNILR